MTSHDTPPSQAVAVPEPLPEEVDDLDREAAGPDFAPEKALAVRRQAAAALSFVGLPSPEEFAVLQRMSTGLATSGLLPEALRGKEAADKVMVILLKGRELGVPPMAAIANIHVVSGKPGLSGAMMMALVQRAGHSIEVRERTSERAVVWGRRADTGVEQSVVWTWDMAVRAQLVVKDTWRNYPDAMLTWRAVSALCRLLFADVMLGAVYTPEELGADTDSAGIPTMNVRAERRPARPAPAPADQKPAPTAEPAPAEEEPPAPLAPPPPPPSRAVLLRMIDVSCERLRTKPARLLAGLSIQIQRNYEDATDEELWTFLLTNVAGRLRERGMELPDPDDLVLPEPDTAGEGEPESAGPPATAQIEGGDEPPRPNE